MLTAARRVRRGDRVQVVSDSFTRANGALGTAPTGQVWSTNAVFAISSNVAATASADANGAITTVDPGAQFGNCVVYAVMPTLVGDQGLVARFVDSNNYYTARHATYANGGAAGGLALFKRVAGTFTELGTTTGQGTAIVAGQTLMLLARDNRIVVLVNRVVKISVTDTAISRSAGSRAGLRSSSSGSQWDDFRVENAFG